MIDYISGELVELTPTYAIIDASGIGYQIHIALPTYASLNGMSKAKLFIYEAIREDAHLLFGFLNTTERQLFLLLISVSGIGANTARMILSSYSAQEIREMIATGNIAALNSIKGIGSKTAQRIIVDLKDKILKTYSESESSDLVFTNPQKEQRDEAVAALVMLGFNAGASQKAVEKIQKDNKNLPVEQLIKIALKML